MTAASIATTPEPDCPGTIARPPRLYTGFLALGLGLQYLWPVAVWPAGAPTGFRYGAGALLVALGIGLMAAALGRFRRAATHVETYKPTTALVTDGVYRVTRNPMYVSLTLFYVGLGLAADSLWVLALLPPLLLLMRYGVIAREERYLRRKFGARYLEYQASARRWL